MRDTKEKILVWLASPMGDAILCTPALRAIRRHFQKSRIFLFAKPTVKEILSPGEPGDEWLLQQSRNPLAIAKRLRKYGFTHAILFKNSFASALAVLLAQIPVRIGYAREGRGVFLNEKLYPPKLADGSFKPISMIDYYLAISSWLGCESTGRMPALQIDPEKERLVLSKLPELAKADGPVVVLVPGGAFGPSKCWPSERYAQTADRLISNYNATVVISAAANAFEKQIARQICDASGHKLINLAENPVSLGELKAMFSFADLVISNDTGPRHIAIALGRKVVTLFGPNDPAWTDTGCENELKLIGEAPCSPCHKPVCRMDEHLCMQAITVEMVCDAAKKLLEDEEKPAWSVKRKGLKEVSRSFFVDAGFEKAFMELGLKGIDDIFAFNCAKELVKDNLAGYRSRLQFETDTAGPGPTTTMFLKRYERPPKLVQLKNWLQHRRRISCGLCNCEPAKELSKAGIAVPRTISYGQEWGLLFEKRSFIITEKIPNAVSLERRLPRYFDRPGSVEDIRDARKFIGRAANFIRRFHDTGFRHRDLYFCHIFYNDNDEFYLIDLARVFKPLFLCERFRIKDIAQIHYSAPGCYFSNSDRLRFYLGYVGSEKLTRQDKRFIKKVTTKALRMAQHDIKHGRDVPFKRRCK